MNVNYKKVLKLVTLLISSLLIATASASVLNQMFMEATPIGVEGLTLKWVLGNDASDAGTSINEATCTMNGLTGKAGQTSTYQDPVRLNNTGPSTVTFNITVQECSGSTANLTSVEIGIYNVTNSASIENLTIWDGSTGGPWTNLPIPSKNEWRFQWEITWAANATTSDSATVKLVFDVGS